MELELSGWKQSMERPFIVSSSRQIILMLYPKNLFV